MNLNLRNIEQLKSYKFRDKQQILAIAISQLAATQKVLLSCCKLAILMPFFVSLVYFEGWYLLPPLLLAGVLYPLLTTPIEIAFTKHRLTSAIKEFEKTNQNDKRA
jgi:fatty acid desaturase